VVVLHGCTQSAASYNYGTGWSTLADRYGFALLLPEQQRSNNQNGCFNWFLPDDTRRGAGEALSIRQMIEKKAIDHGIDRHRVFITGLSAGGAMANVMLACYPEVFTAGAIIAGLPYGSAANVQQAFESMFQSPQRPATTWGNLVREAAQHRGPWPRVSVWQGTADRTVAPANAKEILKQWTNVHSLSSPPTVETVVDGYPRQAWLDDAGTPLVESVFITDMAHGAPLATNTRELACGVAGPFLLEVGISSTYHIAAFFELVPETAFPKQSVTVLSVPRTQDSSPRLQSPEREALDGEILETEFRPKDAGCPPPSPTVDIGAVITKALRAAGLMRNL
jgi:feruloyl esterase